MRASAVASKKGPTRPRSLASRYLLIVVVVELAFGAIVAAAVSSYILQQAATDRRESRQVLSSAVAASLVGVMRGPDTAGLAAAVDAVTGHSGLADIVAVSVSAPGGEVLYMRGVVPTDAVPAQSGDSLGDLVRPSIQQAGIFEGGRFLGTLEVVYAPIGIANVVAIPLAAIVLIVIVAVLFSSLWTTWLMSSTVAVPIAGLRDAASAIAEGRRNVPLPVERTDELGELARGIDAMMEQLDERERELNASYHSLEEAFQRQAVLKEDLESALRTRSDFFAVASHEIRSPLAVIRMYAEMLRDGEYGDLASAQGEAVDSISAASSRLTSIVADLMDVALLDRGLMPLSFGTVDLGALVEQAVRDVSALGGSAGVAVRIVGAAKGVVVRGDELRIRQVLDNLLDNALRYSEGSPVSVSLEGGVERAEIRVADRGPGVPAEKRHLLFELFRRVETGDDSAASGLGLGLAISQRIAEAHGGGITVEDNLVDGRGAVFVLDLPYDGSHKGDDAPAISVVERRERGADE